MEQTDSEQFRVEHQGDVHAVKGRREAIRMAKRLSNERQGRVVVEREDGAVRMLFRGGTLETLVAETPDRTRRRRH